MQQASTALGHYLFQSLPTKGARTFAPFESISLHRLHYLKAIVKLSIVALCGMGVALLVGFGEPQLEYPFLD